MNELGVEFSWIGLTVADQRDAASRVPYLDFTVDGHSLGDRFGGDITALSPIDAEFRTTNLNRLAGHEVPTPTFDQKYRRSRVDRLLGRRGVRVAFHESAFRDGRVGLYYCWCGDVDCGVLSTHVEITPDIVVWHEVDWQSSVEPFEPRPAVARGESTFRFARAQYDSLFRRLLGADWSRGVPDPDDLWRRQ